MLKRRENCGFSLAETLIALAILAVGMVFIAGAFPVAIQLMTQSTERSIAAVAAEEAFAKVKLYAKGDPTKDAPAIGNDDIQVDAIKHDSLMDFNDFVIFPAVRDIQQYEFMYPSFGFLDPNSQYCWSALCRRTGTALDSPVQVTVFVCRKTGRSIQYYKHEYQDGAIRPGARTNLPEPVKISVTPLGIGRENQLRIDTASERALINDDYIIVNNLDGQIYRVVKRLPNPDDDTIQLDRNWQGDGVNVQVWTIPPAIGGGRNLCIGVFQKTIKF